MKHLKVSPSIISVFILPVLLFLVPFFASASEQIDSFVSDIYLKPGGSFIVVESITYDFGTEDTHGIFRYIEKKHPQDASSFWKKRYIDFDLHGVNIDGVLAKYEVINTKDQLDIKIGDPTVIISGVHTYTIEYEVYGAYSFFDDSSAELYWNVTGNGWEVPIESVTARIHPDGVVLLGDTACYKGGFGLNTSCADTVTLDDGTVEYTADSLSSGSGLTIAHAVDGTSITHTIFEQSDFTAFYILLITAFFFALGIFGYRYKTAFKTHDTIIPQYQPYKNFKPMYSGLLIDGKLDSKDITAGIVYLAQQGFLKISKIERKVLFLFEVDDYKIELLRRVSEIESAFLTAVLELLFSPSAYVSESVTLSDLKANMSKQRENVTVLSTLRTDLKSDMQESGFIQLNEKTFLYWFLIGVFFIALLFFANIVIDTFSIGLFIFLILVSVSSFIFASVTHRRITKTGYEAREYLEGFKLFLSVTDKERFAFHNAPQKSPEQFMEYLPYAIAFGVEKKWAEVFKDLTLPNPLWYENGNSSGSFSAVNLATSLGAFSTTLSTSSSATTSGGSGGGGFSGGGGGGGGGGSW